jgi:Xaa-Pro aminopeptidase
MVRTWLFAIAFSSISLPASADDVTPDIPASVYAKRRERLMQKLGDCVGAIKSHEQAGEYGDATDKWFFYLTGVRESGAVLVLAPREPIYRQQLEFRPRDAEGEIWEGYREPMSLRLRKKYGVDHVGRTHGGVGRRTRNAFRRSRCYAELRPTDIDQPAFASHVLGDILSAFEVSTKQKWKELEAMRAVHDAEEIARMDKAIAITFEGHRAAVRHMRGGVTERKVAAQLENAFHDAGATGVAFPSIVASAENGAVLHWRAGDRAMGENDMVVVDIGAEFGGYAADITRTWPVSGTFSPEQKKIYEIVLRVQQQVMDAVKPGISLDQLNEMALGLLADAGHELPHGVGHFVGLDVHDVGDTSSPLEAGMVITVEPGIYLAGQFGVRIEDMVLVTERGHRHMSSGLPRSVAEIEAWMAKARQ